MDPFGASREAGQAKKYSFRSLLLKEPTGKTIQLVSQYKILSWFNASGIMQLNRPAVEGPVVATLAHHSPNYILLKHIATLGMAAACVNSACLFTASTSLFTGSQATDLECNCTHCTNHKSVVEVDTCPRPIVTNVIGNIVRERLRLKVTAGLYETKKHKIADEVRSLLLRRAGNGGYDIVDVTCFV